MLSSSVAHVVAMRESSSTYLAEGLSSDLTMVLAKAQLMEEIGTGSRALPGHTQESVGIETSTETDGGLMDNFDQNPALVRNSQEFDGDANVLQKVPIAVTALDLDEPCVHGRTIIPTGEDPLSNSLQYRERLARCPRAKVELCIDTDDPPAHPFLFVLSPFALSLD